MFKKFSAARTNNSESSSPERLMAGARTRRDKRTLEAFSLVFTPF
jgi:hypothetical protein